MNFAGIFGLQLFLDFPILSRNDLLYRADFEYNKLIFKLFYPAICTLILSEFF